MQRTRRRLQHRRRHVPYVATEKGLSQHRAVFGVFNDTDPDPFVVVAAETFKCRVVAVRVRCPALRTSLSGSVARTARIFGSQAGLLAAPTRIQRCSLVACCAISAGAAIGFEAAAAATLGDSSRLSAPPSRRLPVARVQTRVGMSDRICPYES